LGFRTYLVDPRTAFASPERFPHADELIQRWPDEALPDIGLNRETNVVVVTHDPKLDDPALMVALPSSVGYVGALGSPKTHAQRIERLLANGLTPAQVDRLHAPIGLDLGGRTPAEIALSIMAEIVAVRNGVPKCNSTATIAIQLSIKIPLSLFVRMTCGPFRLKEGWLAV
jgi:xanthine dehydrogenase accessory factor